MQLPKPSYVIVVSEKGGSERRVNVSSHVVNIGRVQGNEITLGKTNVSKQHATLTLRDGAFIVADLGSTNGTYVNRRRIQEPTKVGESDRIYICDFVLRIEPVAPLPSSVDSEVPVDVVDVSSSSHGLSDSTTTKGKVPAEVNQAGRDAISRGASYPEVPAAPKVPSPGTNVASWSDNSTGRLTLSTEDLQQVARSSLSESNMVGASATLVPSDRTADAVLSTLVEGVIDALGERWANGVVDHEQQGTVERLIEEQMQRLLQAGGVAPSIQPERLRVLARSEVLGLGSLGKQFEDPQVSELLVPRHDQIWIRRGAALELAEQGISSRRALRRIIYRLCLKSGKPAQFDEATLERVLPGGGVLWAVLPPQSLGQPSLFYRRARELPASLQNLVRVGVVSRAMSVFLTQAVAARCRILVVGAREADIGAVAGALLSSASEGSIAVLEGATDLCVIAPQLPCFRWTLVGTRDPGALLRAASRAANCQLGVVLEGAATTAALCDVIGRTSVGVVAVREGRSSDSTLMMMSNELQTVHCGLSADAARRIVASSFDLILEVVRFRDGRQRLVRVSEIDRVTADEIELHDVFAFVTAGGANGDVVEGTFRSSGAIPKFVEELVARGANFDTNVFARPTPR